MNSKMTCSFWPCRLNDAMREREDYDEDLQALHKLMERATKDAIVSCIRNIASQASAGLSRKCLFWVDEKFPWGLPRAGRQEAARSDARPDPGNTGEPISRDGRRACADQAWGISILTPLSLARSFWIQRFGNLFVNTTSTTVS